QGRQDTFGDIKDEDNSRRSPSQGTQDVGRADFMTAIITYIEISAPQQFSHPVARRDGPPEVPDEGNQNKLNKKKWHDDLLCSDIPFSKRVYHRREPPMVKRANATVLP